jgi:two-component system KDP operon response regulator KdpE
MSDKKRTVLVVDDEAQIRKMLGVFLDSSGLKILECGSGQQAIRMCAAHKPDLVLLDLGLPDMNGKDVIAEMRQWSQVPIIVLSVHSHDEEVVAALNLGADDYIIKPFSVDVLMARINANLRKSFVGSLGEPQLTNGPLRMDLVRHEVYLQDKKVALTPKEYELLRFFMINRGRMLTHKQILSEVWGPTHCGDTQYLRVYVGQVRDKLEDEPSNPRLIVTETGVGYRMESLPQTEATAVAA